MELDFSCVWQYWPFLYHGALTTLKMTAICAVFGFLLGVLLSLVKISKCAPLVWFGRFYTSIFRGTPLLVQLCIVHFGLPQLLDITFTTTQSGILTFSLNSAAYISEIFRGGITGVDKGQYEAAMSLGVGYRDMMKDIILPQAIKHILPSLVNEAIALLKESSILSYIGAVELLRAADQITVLTFRFFEPYLVIALIYFASGRWKRHRSLADGGIAVVLVVQHGAVLGLVDHVGYGGGGVGHHKAELAVFAVGVRKIRGIFAAAVRGHGDGQPVRCFHCLDVYGFSRADCLIEAAGAKVVVIIWIRIDAAQIGGVADPSNRNTLRGKVISTEENTIGAAAAAVGQCDVSFQSVQI